jgi:hypothetical protein
MNRVLKNLEKQGFILFISTSYEKEMHFKHVCNNVLKNVIKTWSCGELVKDSICHYVGQKFYV